MMAQANIISHENTGPQKTRRIQNKTIIKQTGRRKVRHERILGYVIYEKESVLQGKNIHAKKEKSLPQKP